MPALKADFASLLRLMCPVVSFCSHVAQQTSKQQHDPPLLLPRNFDRSDRYLLMALPPTYVLRAASVEQVVGIYGAVLLQIDPA